MLRWRRPHPVTGWQLLLFFVQVLCLVSVAWLTLTDVVEPSTGWVFGYVLGFGGLILARIDYVKGIHVGRSGLKLRSQLGNRTLRWDEINAFYSRRSRATEARDPAIWAVLTDGERIELPVQGTNLLPALGSAGFTLGTKTLRNPSLVLSMDQYRTALDTLNQLLHRSRAGNTAS